MSSKRFEEWWPQLHGAISHTWLGSGSGCLCSCWGLGVDERKKEVRPWAQVKEGNGSKVNLFPHPTGG